MIAVGLRRLNWMLSERGIPGEAAKGGSWSDTQHYAPHAPLFLTLSQGCTVIQRIDWQSISICGVLGSRYVPTCTCTSWFLRDLLLSVVTPGVLVKNLKKYATKNTLHWKKSGVGWGQGYDGYTLHTCSGGLLMWVCGSGHLVRVVSGRNTYMYITLEVAYQA